MHNASAPFAYGSPIKHGQRSYIVMSETVMCFKVLLYITTRNGGCGQCA